MAYNLAIIGMGAMAQWHIDSIAKHVPEITVVGCCDVRGEAAARGLKAYASPEEICADKSVDLVLVATPNDTHRDFSVRCLDAGKHVVCEKPATMNAREMEDVIAAQRRSGKIFTVHQNRRWDADFLAVKKILADGTLKPPFSVKSSVHGSRMLFGWRAFKPNGGGLLLDWGVHLIDQLLCLFDENVVSVYGHLNSVTASDVDDSAMVVMRFESGRSGIVDISSNSYVPEPRWRVFCEDGTAVINPNWDLSGKIVKLADASVSDWEDAVVYTLAGPTRTMLPRPKDTTVELPLPRVEGGMWHLFYKNLVAALDGKEAPAVTPGQALRVMKVVDAAFESSATNRAVSDVI